MNILQITPLFPYPPDSGGRIGIFNSIKYLSKWHTITLLSFVQKGDESYIPELKKYCDEIYTVEKAQKDSILKLLCNLFSLRPYNMAKYSSPQMALKIEELLNQ